MKKRYAFLTSVFLVLVLVLGGCQLSTSSGTPTTPTSPTVSTIPASNGSGTSSGAVADFEATLEDIYNRVNPSVVNVSIPQALGSGFIFDNSGHIVTNNHVVEGNTSVSITFSDGTTIPGQVIGTDPDSDLAVIEADVPSDYQPVQMGDSTQVKVGQLSVAIGNPFGLQGTMTVGFISGLGRLLPANENAVGPSYSIPDIIQTDAPINPGNSGGVLLDENGDLIGVPSSIATTTGTSSGVGFAIPSAIVQQVVPSLISTGHYDHPYLGISVISMSPDVATAMNLPSGQRGALVEEVVSGSPADNAGLRAGTTPFTISGQQILIGGDVIIAYNGEPVNSSDQLITLLARSGAVGETITLTVLRDGSQMDIPVVLGARPSS